MKKVKFFLIWGLVLLLTFTACSSTQGIIEESTAETSSSDIFTGTVLEISKYGNTYIDVKSADFLSGFDNGDIVRVSVNGYEITAPVVTSYSDVDNGSPLVKTDGEYVEVALSYADFASSYSVAVGSDEDYIERAMAVAIENGQLSTSMLQRKLKLGYARAARIMDELEEMGVIAPSEGAKPRKVLMSRLQFEERRARKMS